MVAYVMVDISKFRGFQSETVKVNNHIDRINSELSAISRALDWDVSSCAGINHTLAQIHGQLDRYSAVVKKMAKFLDFATQEYSRLDQTGMQEISAIQEGSVVTPKNNRIIASILKWFGAAVKTAVVTTIRYFMENEIISRIVKMVGMPIVLGKDAVTGFVHKMQQLYEYHYIDRVRLNRISELPQTVQEAEDAGFVIMSEAESQCHRMGLGNEHNVKYINHETGQEAVYKDGKLVTDPLNMGSYNYVKNPTESIPAGIGHFERDVLPWLILGNTPYDYPVIGFPWRAFYFMKGVDMGVRERIVDFLI